MTPVDGGPAGEPPDRDATDDPWEDEEDEYVEPDRSGLTSADFEPKAPTRLGKRLRFLTAWQVFLIVVAILVVVPLILAVVLNPVIGFLSRT
ncbi:MAG: hypothetical protein M3O87_04040 [Candidatus Dormibacteraeota bacterium]|nr:hypothetical protein [Candidatus Dormibacteraeota bacterium]